MNDSHIFYNGDILPAQQPVAYANDRGLLLADGLFETIRYRNNSLEFFELHYLRMKESADILSIPFKFTSEWLHQQCLNLLAANRLLNKIVAVRITLSRRSTDRSISITSELQPSLLITTDPYIPKTKNVRLCITDVIRNEFSMITRMKTLQFIEPILARKYARARGFDDGIMRNTKGAITEASTASIFFIKGEGIITPPTSDGMMPGVIRHVVLDLCERLGIEYHEQSIYPTELAATEGAFMTNSLIGIQGIHSINEKVYTPTDLQEHLNHGLQTYLQGNSLP